MRAQLDTVSLAPVFVSPADVSDDFFTATGHLYVDFHSVAGQFVIAASDTVWTHLLKSAADYLDVADLKLIAKLTSRPVNPSSCDYHVILADLCLADSLVSAAEAIDYTIYGTAQHYFDLQD